MQPLGTNKNYATSEDKKITKPLETKNLTTSQDKKKITQPFRTTKLCLTRDNKITQPLGIKKSHKWFKNTPNGSK